MPVNVNCTSYKFEGKCLHQAAPRKLFGPAICIVWEWHVGIHKDPRMTSPKCALCTPVPKIILNSGEVAGK